jgi:ABC-2 type transport system permease protein
MTASRSSLRTTLRALPTLLRVGAAETLAYRAEFVVWMLTTTLPLVMLALWTSVASEGPFRGWASADFIAYYLGALIVRNLTGSWVVWQINDEVRRGVMSMRLLRPIHPFVAYAATHLSAVPMRTIVVMPVAIALLATTGRNAITHDPVHLALLVPSLAAAWALTFGLLLAIGCLAFFIEKSMAVMEVYFGVFAVLSGYMLPQALLPGWIAAAADWTPFPSMLAAPLAILLGRGLALADVLAILATQAGWTIGVAILAAVMWRRGIRRFEAVGG